MTTTVSAHEAVERLLSARIQEDPGFLTELMNDPKAAIAPLLADAVGDEVDLGDTSVVVHFETDKVLHFVVPLAPAGDEVAGFAMTGAPIITMDTGGWGRYRGVPCDLTSPRGGSGTVLRPTGHVAYCEPVADA